MEGDAQRPTRGLAAVAGLLLAAAVAWLGPWPVDAPEVGWMAGVAVWMASWWLLEVVPIPVTALLPLVLLPLAGIAPLSEVSANYGKPTIFLFLGGFLLALGLQRTGLHRRLALAIVHRVGREPAGLVGGFMAASALLSMWLSNTASVMVMMPIGLSVLTEARARGLEGERLARLGAALMLGIAYAADIGGMATPIGTPPNLVLLDMQRTLLPDLPPIGFGAWMVMGLPLAAVFGGLGWLLLTRVVFRLERGGVFGGRAALGDARAALGSIRRDEVVAGGVFGLTALAWVSGSDLSLGTSLTVPGWRSLTGLTSFGDASVAVLGAVSLFLWPSADRPGETLLRWEDAREVPWGILLLFGGGFALAHGFQVSGLSAVVGAGAAQLEGLSEPVLAVVVATTITFLTELTSNTATTTLVLPILAEAAQALQVDPRALMVPATLSASCAFMMPVASPTQAIVFGSGFVSIRQMATAGLGFNLLGIVLVVGFWLTLGVWALGV